MSDRQLIVKQLDPTAHARIESILAEHNGTAPLYVHTDFEEYPKILFHRDYLEQRDLAKNATDQLAKAMATEQMRRLQVVVQDIDEEEEMLADGYVRTTAELEMRRNGGLDPRIPRGREQRLASAQKAIQQEQELNRMRIRYLELTGRRMSEDVLPVSSHLMDQIERTAEQPIDMSDPEFATVVEADRRLQNRQQRTGAAKPKPTTAKARTDAETKKRQGLDDVVSRAMAAHNNT